MNFEVSEASLTMQEGGPNLGLPRASLAEEERQGQAAG